MSVLIAGVNGLDEFEALWNLAEGAGCDYASDCPSDEYCVKNVCSRSLGGLSAAEKKDKKKDKGKDKDKGKKDDKPAEAKPKSEDKPKDKGGGGGMLVPVLLGVAAVGVGAVGVWWWKRRR